MTSYNSSFDPPTRPTPQQGPPELSASEKRDRENDVREKIVDALEAKGVHDDTVDHYVRKLLTFSWSRSGALTIDGSGSPRNAVYVNDIALGMLAKIPTKDGGRMLEPEPPPTKEKLKALAAKRYDVAREF